MELYVDRNLLTPIQLALLEKLADGQKHWVRELIPVIDTYATKKSVSNHVQSLRALLRPRGHDIVCVCHGRKTFYQHVVLLRTAE